MLEIEAPTVGSAYVLGFRNIGNVLREYWWLYALAATTEAALNASGTSAWQLCGGFLCAGIAPIAALATTARMVRRDAHIRALDVLALIAFALINIAIFAAAIGISYVVSLLASGFSFFVGLAALSGGTWLVFKLAIAHIVYVNARTRNIGEALTRSFDVVAGACWWRYFGLTVAISLSLFAPVTFVAFRFPHALHDPGFTPRFFSQLLFVVLMTVAVVWSTAASTAFASALGILET